MAIQFFVPGKPQTAGSKKGFSRGRHVSIVDANDKTKPWQAQVALFAREAYSGPLLEGPIAVTFVFFRLRPAGHLGTGRNAGILKASAPIAPATIPDVLKLARAVEDALTGVLWRDDAQIVNETLLDRYGVLPGVAIEAAVISAVRVPAFVSSVIGEETV